MQRLGSGAPSRPLANRSVPLTRIEVHMSRVTVRKTAYGLRTLRIERTFWWLPLLEDR
jgi:hypothetical protein